jgi:hypothetical protein
MGKCRDLMWTRAWTLVICWALATGASAAENRPAFGDEPSVPRSYEGHVLSGTGAYDKAAGTVTAMVTSRLVKEVPRAFEGGSEYAVAITLRGASCHARPTRAECPSISGRLTGTAVREPHIGDGAIADRFVSLSGRLGALGAVTASGRLQGTGFIARGRRHLYIVLASAKGTISIGAGGPVIPGFQSP